MVNLEIIDILCLVFSVHLVCKTDNLVESDQNLSHDFDGHYSYLPNKIAGPNKRVGWKIGQNQIIVQG